MLKNFFRSKNGFSLIETMIVTGIMTVLILGSITMLKYSQKNQGKINLTNLRNQLIVRFTNLINDPNVILMSAGNQANLFACVGNRSSCGTTTAMVSSLLNFCGSGNDCVGRNQTNCNQWVMGPTTYLSGTQKVFCAWASNACSVLTTNVPVNVNGSVTCPVASTGLTLYDQTNNQISNYYDMQGNAYNTQPNITYYYSVSVSYSGNIPPSQISVGFSITPSIAIINNYGIQAYTSPNITYSVPMSPVLLSNSGFCNFLGGTAGTTTCASIPTVTLTATLGGSCSYLGSLGQDSSGAIYECNGNQWTLPANSSVTEGGSCSPQGAIGQASTAYGWSTYVCNGTWISTNSGLYSTVASESTTIASQSTTIGSQSTMIGNQSTTISNQSGAIIDNTNTIASQSNTMMTNASTIASQSTTINTISGTAAYKSGLVAGNNSIINSNGITLSNQSTSISTNSSTIASYSSVINNATRCSSLGGSVNYNYTGSMMCIFNGSSCPSGFTPYITNGKNWLETSSNTSCSNWVSGGTDSWGNYVTCDAGNCTAYGYGFSNQNQECCTCYMSSYVGSYCSYDTPTPFCASITKIGCQ
jgi:hypothetical protein